MKQASQLRYLLATLMLIEKMDIEKPKTEEKTEIEKRDPKGEVILTLLVGSCLLKNTASNKEMQRMNHSSFIYIIHVIYIHIYK